MIVKIVGHGFEVYTLVSEIHKNIDLVLGIKNVLELRVYLICKNVSLVFLTDH